MQTDKKVLSGTSDISAGELTQVVETSYHIQYTIV